MKDHKWALCVAFLLTLSVSSACQREAHAPREGASAGASTGERPAALAASAVDSVGATNLPASTSIVLVTANAEELGSAVSLGTAWKRIEATRAEIKADIAARLGLDAADPAALAKAGLRPTGELGVALVEGDLASVVVFGELVDPAKTRAAFSAIARGEVVDTSKGDDLFLATREAGQARLVSHMGRAFLVLPLGEESKTDVVAKQIVEGPRLGSLPSYAPAMASLEHPGQVVGFINIPAMLKLRLSELDAVVRATKRPKAVVPAGAKPDAGTPSTDAPDAAVRPKVTPPLLSVKGQRLARRRATLIATYANVSGAAVSLGLTGEGIDTEFTVLSTNPAWGPAIEASAEHMAVTERSQSGITIAAKTRTAALDRLLEAAFQLERGATGTALDAVGTKLAEIQAQSTGQVAIDTFIPTGSSTLLPELDDHVLFQFKSADAAQKTHDAILTHLEVLPSKRVRVDEARGVIRVKFPRTRSMWVSLRGRRLLVSRQIPKPTTVPAADPSATGVATPPSQASVSVWMSTLLRASGALHDPADDAPIYCQLGVPQVDEEADTARKELCALYDHRKALTASDRAKRKAMLTGLWSHVDHLQLTATGDPSRLHLTGRAPLTGGTWADVIEGLLIRWPSDKKRAAKRREVAKIDRQLSQIRDHLNDIGGLAPPIPRPLPGIRPPGLAAPLRKGMKGLRNLPRPTKR